MRRHIYLASVAALAVCESVHAQAPVKAFDVAAQPVESAVGIFGRQADVQILASRRLTHGKLVNAVHANATVEEGLRLLFAGTGLTARRTGQQTYTVVPAGEAAASASSMMRPAGWSPDAQANSPSVVASAPSGAAAADSASASGAEDIVVTGFRASLANALQGKKIAPVVQEVLSAEDIGKLPDNNIAESLARLPGLSTNRDRGNPTTISIRGMPAELTNTLLNGREIVTGDPSRNIRFDQYPAELINGAAVYKSPQPSQVEGAIAGQVDLKTLRPLDFKDRQIVLNARAEYNDQARDTKNSKSVGWIASGSYVGQFADDTLGVAFGVAARNEPVSTRRTNIYRYTGSFADLNGDGVQATPTGDKIPYGFEALQRGGSDKRIGALGTVQWKGVDGLEITADGFYSRVKYEEYQRGFVVRDLPFGNSFSGITLVDGSANAGSATNFADYGLKVQNSNQYYTFKDELYAGGLNAKYDTDRLHFTGDFGYSRVTRHAMFLNTYSSVVNPDGSLDTDGVSVNWQSFKNAPSQLGTNVDLLDTRRNYVTNLEIPSNGNGAPIIHDELYSLRGDTAYDVDSGFLKALKAGGRFTTRSKDLTQRTQYSSASPWGPLNSSYLLSPVTWSGKYAGLPSSLAWDVKGVADALFGGINPAQSVDDQRSSWQVDEKTFAGYVQADFNAEFGGSVKLTGNAGVRFVRTEITSHGAQIIDNVVSPTAFHNNFSDWLPSLNATLHLNDRQQIRFAVAKVMARTSLDDLNAGFAFYPGTPPSAYGGNPALKPYRAKQVDLAYEHYFNRDTAATISLFYKKLDSFVVQQVSDITIGGVTYQDAFRQPINGSGGSVKGFEVLYQQAFTFLPGALSGFGIYANYSFTDSNVSVAETDNLIGLTSLPGLSKHVGNVALYYSKFGIDARVGYRYRSSFAVQTGDTDRILYNKGEGVLSAQLGYEFPEASPLTGLKITLQADNLTDTPYRLYYGNTSLQGRYETFGRRFYLGATYKF